VVRSLGVSAFAVVMACGIWHAPPDAGLPPDAATDAAPDAAAWLATCQQYYGQANLASGGCTTCQQGACGTQQQAEFDVCSGDGDTQCYVKCGQTPPYPPDYCTCLEGCLSAPCIAALPPYLSCELSACGTVCQ
jgi:hypothetical protein